MTRPTLLLAGILVLGCSPRAHDAARPVHEPPAGPFAELPFPVVDDLAFDPELGFVQSRAHVLISFKAAATEAEAARAIAASGGSLVGALGEARLAMIRLPAELDGPSRRARVAALRADPAVSAALFDMPLFPANVPPESSDQPGWRWEEPDKNWHLAAMGMPVAWNLVPLIEQERAQRRVKVTVIDSQFQRHTDLVPDTLALVGGPRVIGEFAPDDATALVQTHGTSVAGLIGARWDGRMVDGVSPFVALTGAGLRLMDRSDTAEVLAIDFASVVQHAWHASAATGPRIVNLSLTSNFSTSCFLPTPGVLAPGVRPQRCDPRQGLDNPAWGPAVADSNCNASALREQIAAGGIAFDDLVSTINTRRRKVMFVVGAGNDSGPRSTTGYCDAPRSSRRGMGEFPAELASPMAWAGIQRANPNILVVEVVQRTSDMRGPVTRAPYSNVNAHLLAPGDDVGALIGGGTSSRVGTFNGTSAAAPIVTGALAYLVALDPDVTNPQLRDAILAQHGPAVTGTRTTSRLYVPTAIEHLDVHLPGGTTTARGGKVLADMDDGTLDGLTRVLYSGRGVPVEAYTRRRTYGPAPVVNLADARYLRDSIAFAAGTGADCPAVTPACDLNGDGRVRRGGEPRARGELGHARFDVAKLAPWWDGDRVQGYTAGDLPMLMSSADIYLLPETVLRRAGLRSIKVTLGGATAPGAPVMTDLGPVTEREVTGVVTLTTPLIRSANIRVELPAPVNRVFTKQLGDLIVGQDVPIALNECALEPGSTWDLFEPYVPGCQRETTSPQPPPPPPTPTPEALTCDQLERSTAVYFCLVMSGHNYRRTVVWKQPAGSTATMRAYYRTAVNRTFIRLTGQDTFDGIPQIVRIDATVRGHGASSEPWPMDFPQPFAMTFLDAKIPGGRGSVASATPIGTTSPGATAITRYGAVDGMIEGTFRGRVQLDTTWPQQGTVEGVSVSGKFRVVRGQDMP